jgi:hypothetical protein
VAYIVRKWHDPVIIPEWNDREVLDLLETMISDIDRDPGKHEKWFWRGEFSREQLRRKRDGQVVGECSELYRRLKNCPTERLSPTLSQKIQRLLAIAERTFANRLSRQKAFFKRKRELERIKHSLVSRVAA